MAPRAEGSAPEIDPACKLGESLKGAVLQRRFVAKMP